MRFFMLETKVESRIPGVPTIYTNHPVGNFRGNLNLALQKTKKGSKRIQIQ